MKLDTDKAQAMPCPFCGSDDIVKQHDDGRVWKQCGDCGATGPANSKYADEDDPVWETRAARSAGLSQEASVADLTRVYDALGIGRDARRIQTLLHNLENLRRRFDCLSAIEREFFTKEVPIDDYLAEEPGDTIDECSLNWGSNPKEYVEQFRVALAELTAPPATVSTTINGIPEIEHLQTGIRNHQEKLAQVWAEYDAYRLAHPATPVSAEPTITRELLTDLAEQCCAAAISKDANKMEVVLLFTSSELAEILEAQPAPAAPLSDAKDAERYRHIRPSSFKRQLNVVAGNMELLNDDALDAAIDASIDQAAGIGQSVDKAPVHIDNAAIQVDRSTELQRDVADHWTTGKDWKK